MKGERERKDYLERRSRLSTETGPRELWSVIDHWPLYCGIGNLARFMAISDLLRETLPVPGHVAEFGSWRGGNLMFLAKLLKIYDPHGSKVVHCFDSFEGLSTFTDEDGPAKAEAGSYSGDLEELQKMIGLYNFQDDIEIHKGNIQDTLPSTLEKDPSLSLSFVYLDTDLFEPTQLILESLNNRLSKGGLFVLDQWNEPAMPGEGIAANQFMQAFGDAYKMRHVLGAKQPTLVLEKLKF